MCKLHEVYDSDITDHMDPFAIESTEDFADSIGNGSVKGTSAGSVSAASTGSGIGSTLEPVTSVTSTVYRRPRPEHCHS